VGTRRVVRELHADFLDIALQLLVVIDAHLAAHLGIHLAPDLDFLVLAHERDLTLSGGRVRSAAGSGDREKCGQKRAGQSHSVPSEGQIPVPNRPLCNGCTARLATRDWRPATGDWPTARSPSRPRSTTPPAVPAPVSPPSPSAASPRTHTRRREKSRACAAR